MIKERPEHGYRCRCNECYQYWMKKCHSPYHYPYIDYWPHSQEPFQIYFGGFTWDELKPNSMKNPVIIAWKSGLDFQDPKILRKLSRFSREDKNIENYTVEELSQKARAYVA